VVRCLLPYSHPERLIFVIGLQRNIRQPLSIEHSQLEMTVTEEIKSRLDIVEVVSGHVTLKKSGSSYSGFCPFHHNVNTPAFVVFPKTQTWRCFGACAEGGDLFSFVMKKEGWEFREALEQLAKRAGVRLEPFSKASLAQKAKQDELRSVLEDAADYFHQLLLYAPQAEKSRHYLAERGINEESIAHFKLGYSLDSWDALHSHFTMQGYDNKRLMAVGLLSHHAEKQSFFDRFRDRLMFPIRDATGKMAGFGARTLKAEGTPKYLNSAQNAIFDKGRLLYGLDSARSQIRDSRTMVIVEGYMDVIQAWQNGYRNVVAQMGTAFTRDQMKLAKRFSKTLILALDADAAGAQATLRSLEVARDAFDRQPDAQFDARSLVRFEGRLQADLRIVSLPDGLDPDELIREAPEVWPSYVDSAKPIVDFVIDTVTEDLNLDDANQKSEAARKILPLIEDVSDPLKRDHYYQLLARRLRINERALRAAQLAERKGTAPSRQVPVDPAAVGRDVKSALTSGQKAVVLKESNYLAHCLKAPQLVNQIDALLLAGKESPVSVEDFSQPEDRELWARLEDSFHDWSIVNRAEVTEEIEDEVLLERVASLDEMLLKDRQAAPDLPARLALSIVDCRHAKVRAVLETVREHLQGGASLSDVEEHLFAQLTELPGRLKNLDQAKVQLASNGWRSRGSGDKVDFH